MGSPCGGAATQSGELLRSGLKQFVAMPEDVHRHMWHSIKIALYLAVHRVVKRPSIPQIADAMPLKTMRGVWRYKEKRDGKVPFYRFALSSVFAGGCTRYPLVLGCL